MKDIMKFCMKNIKSALSLMGFGLLIAMMGYTWFWVLIGVLVLIVILLLVYLRFIKPAIHKHLEKKAPRFTLLYFYGSADDDLGTKIMGWSMADILTSAQNERFRLDPPSIPVESVDVGKRKDLVDKYHVRTFPSFFLVNQKGEVLQKWNGELTGTTINKYIKSHFPSTI